MSELLIRPNSPSRTAEGEMTLTGVVRELFRDLKVAEPKLDVLSRQWNAETQEKYLSDYSERLLPALGEKAVKEYTEEEIRNLLNNLNVTNGYSQSTRFHYNHLTYVLFLAAEQMGICPNVLWGSELGLSIDEDETAVYRLKKSFTVNEQLLIRDALDKPPEQIAGEELGLLLMNEVGLRNNEACGVNYSALTPLQEHPEIFSLKIYQTTKLNSAELKAGGKTRNANRLLPLMPKTRDRLLSQKEYLQKLEQDGMLILPEGKSVEDLPITCRGTDYLQRCKSADLSKAGKQLFRDLGIGEKQLQHLDALIHSEEFREADFPEEELKEKDATTYLFRRNFVTYMELLNFTPTELEYYIGHAVEDDYESRNTFVNEDKQAQIAKKLERHPLNLLEEGRTTSWDNPDSLCEADGVICIDISYGSCVSIRIEPKEPSDKVTITLNIEDAKAASAKTFHVNSKEYERTVDVCKQLMDRYQQKAAITTPCKKGG